MKLFKFVIAGAVAAWGLAPSAYAFHSGGVAECEGCHTMHNSFEGAPAPSSKTPYLQPGPYLLKANDQSSTCLNCHAEPAAGSYHIATATASSTSPGVDSPPIQMTPGGDFGWLKMTRTGSIRKTATTWEGQRQGHNVIAADFGFVKDTVQTKAPGGSYPVESLACSSCHDPHGTYRRFFDGSKSSPQFQGISGYPIFASGSYTNSADPIQGVSAVGVYRLLAGINYQPKSLSGSYAFVNESPDAVAASSYNGPNSLIAGNVPGGAAPNNASDRVAYGRGMSEWCQNCHTAMHNDSYVSGNANHLVHPAGNGAKLKDFIVTNYTKYISSGISGTPPDNGYSALAPFEVGITDSTPASYTALKGFSAAPAAPTTSSNVACVSCHRAHASAFESGVRYYLGNEFMTVANASNAGIYDTSVTENKINTGYSTLAQTNAYNGRPATLFGPFARDYCNKCHGKD